MNKVLNRFQLDSVYVKHLLEGIIGQLNKIFWVFASSLAASRERAVTHAKLRHASAVGTGTSNHALVTRQVVHACHKQVISGPIWRAA